MGLEGELPLSFFSLPLKGDKKDLESGRMGLDGHVTLLRCLGNMGEPS
jgi:hypothetical protein